MRLLVSVAGPTEARAALLGGADVIDAKDPRAGALGPVRPGVLRAVREAVASARPLSVALGDAASPASLERRAAAAARLGAAFVKVGFSDAATSGQARPLAAAARRGAGDRTRVVLVAYADWSQAESLDPYAMITVAAETEAAGVLLDTAGKTASLFTLLDADRVGRWVAEAHAIRLFVGLAGSLAGEEFAMARDAGADLVGVRGAACIGGRTGRVAASRVAALSALTRAPLSPLAALV
ncbi:MAG TPA: (5-formylfuran-3-yl)methyl phosphate synthase [Gemmatimonadales bacterium]|nr:(5-formylfuran-3-yl)methyl phosphate synthase [Gemmatimonadales bacterium]